MPSEEDKNNKILEKALLIAESFGEQLEHITASFISLTNYIKTLPPESPEVAWLSEWEKNIFVKLTEIKDKYDIEINKIK